MISVTNYYSHGRLAAITAGISHVCKNLQKNTKAISLFLPTLYSVSTSACVWLLWWYKACVVGGKFFSLN